MKPILTAKVGPWLNQVHYGDCRETIRAMIADGVKVQMCVTSPPYNIGMEYEEGQTFDEWQALMAEVIGLAYGLLSDGGRLAVNVANVDRNPYRPLTYYITGFCLQNGFLMRGDIIWSKPGDPNSVAWGSWCSPSNPTLRDNHEYILVFSKATYARENKEKTLNSEDFMLYTRSLWSIPPERYKGHPAVFPRELVARLLKLYTFKGDIVFDPFIGSGTTAMVAERLGRKWIGCELNENYKSLIDERTAQLGLGI